MKRTPGFTLIEVLVSVAIMGVIMTLIWSTTTQSLRTKDRVEKRDLQFHIGRVALRKLGDDLTVAFLSKAARASTASPEAIAPATEAAAATTAAASGLKTFFVGEDQGGQDSIKFTSLSHLRLFKNAKESDQCKVMYEVVTSKDDPQVYNLVRREDPWLDETADVKGREMVLISGIKDFDIEYYDSRRNEWMKEWDTQKVDWQSRLPQAVRVRLTFANPEDEEDTEENEIQMSTSVVLTLFESPIEI